MLGDLLGAQPTTARRWKLAAGNAIVLWAASLLGIVILWLAMAWLAQQVWEVRWGLNSPAMSWLLLMATPLCAVFAIVSSIRWIRALPDHRASLQRDIALAEVLEEQHVFVEVMRFEEPEHGGLLYCFHSDDDRVFADFDLERQDLGEDRDAAAASSYRPRASLVTLRGPESGFVLAKALSGPELPVDEPIPLALDPQHWPESETYLDIPWDQLVKVLGPQKD